MLVPTPKLFSLPKKNCLCLLEDAGDAQEPEETDSLNRCAMDGEWGIMASVLSEVDNNF